MPTERISVSVKRTGGPLHVVGRYSQREYRAWHCRCSRCDDDHFLVMGHGTSSIYGRAAFDDIFELTRELAGKIGELQPDTAVSW